MRRLLAAAVIVPMATTIALAIVLAKRAADRPTAIVVPGVREPRGVRTDDCPPEMARDFALSFLAVFDNYTPATIDNATAFLRTRIAPDFFTQADEALERRRKMVLDSRMSSTVAFDRPHEATIGTQGDSMQIAVRGIRRIFVADKLREERTLLYRLKIQIVTPTALNPYGLAVVGQSVTTENVREVDRENRSP